MEKETRNQRQRKDAVEENVCEKNGKKKSSFRTILRKIAKRLGIKKTKEKLTTYVKAVEKKVVEDTGNDDNSYEEETSDGDESEHVASIPWDTDPENVYDFSYAKRGLAVLIINTEFDEKKSNRPAAKTDLPVLTDIFTSLGFDVIPLENKSTHDLDAELKSISRTMQLDYDCFVCAVSSHGAEFTKKDFTKRTEHKIWTTDLTYPTSDIIAHFDEDTCSRLKGKPKLFFIQACRVKFDNKNKYACVDPGVDVDIGYKTVLSKPENNVSSHPDTMTDTQCTEAVCEIGARNSEVDEDVMDTDIDFCDIPCPNDCLIMFSSVPGKIAWNNDDIGSWLCHCLKVAMRCLWDANLEMEFLNVLTLVNNKMALMKTSRNNNQPAYSEVTSSGCLYHRLVKDLYFLPKTPAFIKDISTR